MGVLLGTEHDYLLFLTGVGFLIVAMQAYNLSRSGDRSLPWGYLAGFGIILTLVNWTSAIALVYLPPASVATATQLAAAVAYLLLVEFWRQASARLGVWTQPRWILLPPLALIVLGILTGQTGITIVVNYLLGVVACGFAAYVILVKARRGSAADQRPLIVAAFALSAYAILGMFAEKSVGVFPLSILNATSFESTLRISVQALRAVAVLVLGWQVGAFLQQGTSAMLEPTVRRGYIRLRWLTTTVLFAAFVVGWASTILIGNAGLHGEELAILQHARIAAAGVDVQAVSTLNGVKADSTTSAFLTVQRQLTAILAADHDNTYLYIMTLRDGKVVTVAEGVPEALPNMVDPPGTVYHQASPELLAAAGEPREFIEGPLTDKYGTWYSAFAPIRTRDGRAVALLGVDRRAETVAAAVARARMNGILLSLITSLLILGSYMAAQVSRTWAANVTSTERRFRTVFGNAPEGIFIMSLGSRTILEANPYMSEWLGYPLEQLIGMDVAELVVAGLDGIASCMASLGDGASSVSHECDYKTASGGVVAVEITAVPMDYEGAGCVLVFARDMTARRQAQLATEYRARFYDIVSDISTGFINVEPDRVDEGVDRALELVGGFVDADRAYVFELSDGGDLVSNTHEWVPLQALSRKAALQGVEVTRYPYLMESLAQGNDVLITHIATNESFHEPERERLLEQGLKSLVAVPMQWRGELLGFLGFDSISRESAWTGETVTLLRMAAYSIVNALERKRTNTEVRRLTTALEQSPVGVVMTDRAGAIEYVNQKFMQLTGYSLGELRGQNPRILKSGLTPPETYAELWNTILAGDEWRGEFVNLHKDGTTFWSSATISPIRDYTGMTRHFVCVQEDVTAIKAAEDAMRAAQRAAEDANRAKSEFLASMSHEIRTPMNAIIGMAELLEETELTAAQRRYVDIFQGAGDALLTLINDVLDLSKIEAGKIEIETVPFDLADLVERTVTILGIRSRDKGVELLSRIAPGTPTRLKGDPDRLRQVLTNLVGNAIKFTEEGQVLVSIEVGKELPDIECGIELAVSVTDTGIGIPADKQQSVFESFTQADSSTTRRFGGTGLGLTISRRLVELMGGRIGVTSIEGEGSTFHFTLPVTCADESEMGPERPLARLDGLRVLVVDDNATNRLIVEEMLASWGSLSVSAEDAIEGLAELTRAASRGEPFDVVVLDNRMPEMDGMQLLALMREDPLFAKTGVVLLSSDAVSLSGRLRELGVNDYLMKPVRRADLHDAVATAARTEPEPTAMPEVAATETAETAAPLRILLVEDSEDNRFLLLAHMSKTPHVMSVAENGAEALDAFEQAEEPFDLILMDMQMSVMDGYEATRRIRALEVERGGHTPIVALTAFALKEEVTKSLQAGCDGHLIKPIKKQVLLEAIAHYAKGAGNDGTAG